MEFTRRVALGLIASIAALSAECAEYSMPVRDPVYDTYIYAGAGNRDAGRAEIDVYVLEVGVPIWTDTIVGLGTSYLDGVDADGRPDSGFGDTTVSLTHNVRRTCNDVTATYSCIDFWSLEFGAVGSGRGEPVRDVDSGYASLRLQFGPSLARIETSAAVAYVDAPSNEGDVRTTFTTGIRSRLNSFQVGLDLIVSNRKHTTQETSLNLKGKYQASRRFAFYAGFEEGLSDAFAGHFWQIGLEYYFRP
jgi:hypothetical protein